MQKKEKKNAYYTRLQKKQQILNLIQQLRKTYYNIASGGGGATPPKLSKTSFPSSELNNIENNLENMPLDNVIKILELLDTKEVKNMVLVSKNIRELCLSSLTDSTLQAMDINIKFVSFAYHVANIFLKISSPFKLSDNVDFMFIAGNNMMTSDIMTFYFDNKNNILELGSNNETCSLSYNKGDEEKFISSFVIFMLETFPYECRLIFSKGMTTNHHDMTKFILTIQVEQPIEQEQFRALFNEFSQAPTTKIPKVFTNIRQLPPLPPLLPVPLQQTLQNVAELPPPSRVEFKYVNQKELERLLKDPAFDIVKFCEILQNINDIRNKGININDMIKKHPIPSNLFIDIYKASKKDQLGGSRVNLNNMTLNELKELARSNKFVRYSRLNKNELIKYIS